MRRALLPLLVATQTLPLIAIAPLVVIWFGFGLAPKVLLVAFVTFFPITVSFVEGYAAADRDADHPAALDGRGALADLPDACGCRPRCRSSSPACGSRSPTRSSRRSSPSTPAPRTASGIYMQNAKNSFRTDLVLAAVAVSAALTLALFALTYLVERLALPWVRLQRQAERAS